MRDVGFFAAFLVYCWAGIDPRLIYHWQAPVFTTIPGFFDEFLKYPGGPADYLQNLIAQTYVWRFWGAAALTALAAAVVWLTRTYFGGGALAKSLSFAPALLLAYDLSLYYDRTPIISLLVGLGLAVAILKFSLRWRGEWAVAGVSVAMLATAYYLAGMALVFVAAAAVLVQIAGRRWPPLWIVTLVCAIALPAVVAPSAAREWFLSSDPRRLIVYWGLYLIYAVGGAMRLRRRPLPAVRRRQFPEALATAAVLLCFAGVAAASYRLSSRDRRLTAIDYQTSREDWSAVIDSARRLPAADFNSLTRYEVNLALHASNRLGDEMFRFPQQGPMLLDLRADQFLPYMIRVTDVCLRLGRINEAERFGSEAMLLRARDPRVYRQMASVNLIKERPAAARKFLNVLTYDAQSGAWARERLRDLDRDPESTGDPQIQAMRRRMLRTDDVFPVWQRPGNVSADLDRLLLDQLEQDPGNRMAFEFLIGNALLARDMVAVHALMPRIANITGPGYVEANGQRRTPRHYQEAMAIYANGIGQPAIMSGLVMQPETEQRFAAFKRTVRQYVTREAAMQAVWNEYRDTYFFYFTFGPGDYR